MLFRSNKPYLNNSQTNIWVDSKFIVSKTGTRDLGNGPITYLVGDYIIYDGTQWNRIPCSQTTYVCQNTTSSSVFNNLDWRLNQLPSYLNLDTNSGSLYGRIPYTPTVEQEYSFYLKIDKTDTVKQITSSITKLFNITVKGNFNNDLYWSTPANLGNLNLGYLCEVSVLAKHVNQELPTQYQIISGVLPPGPILDIFPDNAFIALLRSEEHTSELQSH